jgi:hypothetical protein
MANRKEGMPGWLVGRKKIAAYCDMSWDTVKTYYKKYELPIMYLPSGTPVALPDALDRWVILVQGKPRQKK